MALPCAIYRPQKRHFLSLGIDLNLWNGDNHSCTDSPHCGQWFQKLCIERSLKEAFSRTAYMLLIRRLLFLPSILCSPVHRTVYNAMYIMPLHCPTEEPLAICSYWTFEIYWCDWETQCLTLIYLNLNSHIYLEATILDHIGKRQK